MTTNAAAPADETIKCAICGAKIHAVHMHLKSDHPTVTAEEYQAQYPGQPMLSQKAIDAIKKREAEKAAQAGTMATVSKHTPSAAKKVVFHDLFGLGKNAATLSASGKEIMVTQCAPLPEHESMIPEIDPNYVFNLDVLKTMMMGLEMRIPTYLWGHAGTGKTTIFEQIAAYTRRPLFRVQHTANMEEEHIVGGWRLRDGKTHFELGPLGMAMKYGWLYMADEYDFGRPEVTSVYQAVLEGKPLVIKEADPENRVIKPHPDFRIVATGNTNGQGDETGLYTGTNLQNSANYERFGVVQRMDYMSKELEERLVSQQGRIPMADAKKLVDFAKRIREEFDGGRLGNPISPRSLIYAAKIGVGKRDFKAGLDLAFINRLSSTDREAARQVAQRVFA
ncbi:cobaltochelatase, CobS subunit [compost metagenome]